MTDVSREYDAKTDSRGRVILRMMDRALESVEAGAVGEEFDFAGLEDLRRGHRAGTLSGEERRLL